MGENVRQSIVDNIADLVDRRIKDRKQRRLRGSDQTTEIIKIIGDKIARGEL